MKLKHDYEIKSLRAEMERIRADQRRLQTEVDSVRTQSTIKSGDDHRSEERAAIRAIPTEIFKIYRPDKINLTPHHLHLPTYALYIRRTRLGTTIPGITVPP